MTIGDARLFKEIAQTKSVSQGAAHIGISQSAASQHLKEVERRLGLPLVDRSTRPLTLTPAGKLYYDLCRDLLRREELFHAELEELKERVEGEVRIASIYSVGISEMSRLQSEFAARYPGAQLRVDYARPNRIYEAVLAEEADLGIVSYPEASKELATIPWREEEMAVAVAPSHPLSGLSCAKAADLGGCEFVAFDEDLRIRRELDRYLREQGVAVTVTMHFDNIQMIKEAVALGTGISILPARTMRAEVEQGRLVSLPLGAPGLVRPVGIICRRRRKVNRAVQSFLDLLRDETRPRMSTAPIPPARQL